MKKGKTNLAFINSEVDAIKNLLLRFSNYSSKILNMKKKLLSVFGVRIWSFRANGNSSGSYPKGIAAVGDGKRTGGTLRWPNWRERYSFGDCGKREEKSCRILERRKVKLRHCCCSCWAVGDYSWWNGGATKNSQNTWVLCLPQLRDSLMVEDGLTLLTL